MQHAKIGFGSQSLLAMSSMMNNLVANELEFHIQDDRGGSGQWLIVVPLEGQPVLAQLTGLKKIVSLAMLPRPSNSSSWERFDG